MTTSHTSPGRVSGSTSFTSDAAAVDVATPSSLADVLHRHGADVQVVRPIADGSRTVSMTIVRHGGRLRQLIRPPSPPQRQGYRRSATFTDSGYTAIRGSTFFACYR